MALFFKSPVFRCCTLLGLTLLFFPGVPDAKDLFTVNTADQAPYSTLADTGVYDRIIRHLFSRMGIEIRINHLPSARSIENVDIGIDDAEYARIGGLDQSYENIVMVNEKLMDWNFTAFSKDPSIKIHGWESLGRYHLAYMHGWKIYEKNVTRSKSLLVVPSETEMFRLLEQGRVDIILYERLRGLSSVKKNHLTGIYPLDPPLDTRAMFLYVNKRHRALVPGLEKALRAFKATAAYKTILSSATN